LLKIDRDINFVEVNHSHHNVPEVPEHKVYEFYR